MHEKPRGLAEPPADEVFPRINLPEHFLQDREPLIGGLLQALARMTASDHNLHDRDVIRALADMAQRYQTLVSSGLVYAEGVANPVQQNIIDTLQKLLQEFREVEHRHLGYTALKDADILKALVFLLGLAHVRTSGRPLSRGFLDFVRERFAADTGGPDPADAGGSHIILS